MSKFFNGVAAAALIAGFTGTAIAEESADEILVIGSLTPISAAELGASVSVFDADDISLRQVYFLPDLLRGSAGISITQSGSSGLTELRIRGAESDHSLTILDGIEMTDPASIGTVIDYSQLSTAGVERVIVLRGAQSSFYGADALGGVVSIETSDPFGGDHVFVEGEAGSFGTKRFGGGITRSGDNVGMSIGYSSYKTDGFNSVTNGSEKDNADRTILNGKLGVQLSDQLSLSVVGLVTESFTATDGFGAVDSALDSVGVDRQAGRVAATYISADKAWRVEGSTQVMKSDQTFLFGGFAVSGEGLRRKDDLLISRQFDGTGIDHTLTIALQTEKERNAAGGNKFVRDQDSIIGEYRVVSDDGHAASVSVRHDDNKTYENFTSWRAQAVVSLAAETRLHASAGTGIKAPDFSEFTSQFGCAPNFALKPEKSRSFDIGVAHKLSGAHVNGTVDLTYFDATLEDEVKFCFANPVTATSTNIPGKSKRRGVELSGSVILPLAVIADVSYTWLNAQTPAGREEVRRPEHAASLVLSRGFMDDRLGSSVTYTYTGDALDNAGKLDGFSLVDLAISYRLTDQVGLTARANNLFDEDYTEAIGFASAGRGVFVGLRASLGD